MCINLMEHAAEFIRSPRHKGQEKEEDNTPDPFHKEGQVDGGRRPREYESEDHFGCPVAQISR